MVLLFIIVAIVVFTLFCVIRYVILAEYNKVVVKNHISGIFTNLKNYSEQGKDITGAKNRDIYEPKPIDPLKHDHEHNSPDLSYLMLRHE